MTFWGSTPWAVATWARLWPDFRAVTSSASGMLMTPAATVVSRTRSPSRAPAGVPLTPAAFTAANTTAVSASSVTEAADGLGRVTGALGAAVAGVRRAGDSVVVVCLGATVAGGSDVAGRAVVGGNAGGVRGAGPRVDKADGGGGGGGRLGVRPPRP